jgi:hypothetical protein
VSLDMLLTNAGAVGDASVAGARSGLQNRRTDSAISVHVKSFRNQAPSFTALGQCEASNDPDLAAVIEAWDRLPEAISASIGAMVRASAG